MRPLGHFFRPGRSVRLDLDGPIGYSVRSDASFLSASGPCVGLGGGWPQRAPARAFGPDGVRPTEQSRVDPQDPVCDRWTRSLPDTPYFQPTIAMNSGASGFSGRRSAASRTPSEDVLATAADCFPVRALVAAQPPAVPRRARRSAPCPARHHRFPDHPTQPRGRPPGFQMTPRLLGPVPPQRLSIEGTA